MNGMKLEEVGVPHLTDYHNEIEDNATDPLQELIEAKTKTTSSFWQFDENVFFNDVPRYEQVKKKTKIERENVDNWTTIRSQCGLGDSVGIPRHDPKSKGPARTVTNPVEAWYLLLDDVILSIVLKRTNEEIRKIRGKSSHERALDLIELRAWIGLNYLAGLFRNSMHVGPLDELWSLELGSAIFRATMSIKRYEFIATCLRMSNNNTKLRSGTNEVWKKFLINCRSYYSPSAFVVAGNVTEDDDNALLLCDAKTLYLYNALAGEESGYDNLVNIYHLLAEIKGTKRIVITGVEHTSVDLAQQLQQYNLALVGEVAQNASGIPQHPPTSDNWYQPLYNGNLVLHKENLLSSSLPSNINAARLYKTTYLACSSFQKVVHIYNTHNATPEALFQNKDLKEFHSLLNYAGLNAWILLRLSVNEGSALEQRDFLRQLGLYLTQQHLKKRLQNNDRLSLTQKVIISEMLGESPTKYCTIDNQNKKVLDCLPIPEGSAMVSRFAEKRTRCRKCKGSNSPKTRTRCQQCMRNLCHRHIIFRCDDCTGVPAILQNYFNDSLKE